MKLIILLLLVSCGKDPAKKTAPVPVIKAEASELVVEMIDIECKVKNSCQTICLNTGLECLNACEINTPTRTTERDVCIKQCQDEEQGCYNKVIQVTKEEYDLLMSR